MSFFLTVFGTLFLVALMVCAIEGIGPFRRRLPRPGTPEWMEWKLTPGDQRMIAALEHDVDLADSGFHPADKCTVCENKAHTERWEKKQQLRKAELVMKNEWKQFAEADIPPPYNVPVNAQYRDIFDVHHQSTRRMWQWKEFGKDCVVLQEVSKHAAQDADYYSDHSIYGSYSKWSSRSTGPR